LKLFVSFSLGLHTQGLLEIFDVNVELFEVVLPQIHAGIFQLDILKILNDDFFDFMVKSLSVVVHDNFID
jgi:hypothetical protein